MRSSCIRNFKGFSLVEVVIAIGMVTIAFVSVVGLMATGLNLEREAEEAVGISNLITRIIAEKRNNPMSAKGLLPALNSKSSGEIFLTRGVEPVDRADIKAVYRVNYSIDPIDSLVSGEKPRVSLLTISVSSPVNSPKTLASYHIANYILLR